MNRSRRVPRASCSSQLNNEDSSFSSSASPGATQIPNAVQTHLVSDVVKMVLIADGKKLPIKRLDINKLILKEYAKYFAQIMGLVRGKLQKVFGLDLIEVPSKKGNYIVVNAIQSTDKFCHLLWSDEDYQKHELLVIILAMIFMNDNMMYEDDLLKALGKLDLGIHMPSSQFGDVGKLLKQEFGRQLYLDYNAVKDSDPPQVEVRWGERAKLEVSEKDMLEYVCKIYENIKPEQWSSQFRQVQRTEQSQPSQQQTPH